MCLEEICDNFKRKNSLSFKLLMRNVTDNNKSIISKGSVHRRQKHYKRL